MHWVNVQGLCRWASLTSSILAALADDPAALADPRALERLVDRWYPDDGGRVKGLLRDRIARELAAAAARPAAGTRVPDGSRASLPAARPMVAAYGGASPDHFVSLDAAGRPVISRERPEGKHTVVSGTRTDLLTGSDMDVSRMPLVWVPGCNESAGADPGTYTLMTLNELRNLSGAAARCSLYHYGGAASLFTVWSDVKCHNGVTVLRNRTGSQPLMIYERDGNDRPTGAFAANPEALQFRGFAEGPDVYVIEADRSGVRRLSGEDLAVAPAPGNLTVERLGGRGLVRSLEARAPDALLDELPEYAVTVDDDEPEDEGQALSNNVYTLSRRYTSRRGTALLAETAIDLAFDPDNPDGVYFWDLAEHIGRYGPRTSRPLFEINNYTALTKMTPDRRRGLYAAIFMPESDPHAGLLPTDTASGAGLVPGGQPAPPSEAVRPRPRSPPAVPASPASRDSLGGMLADLAQALAALLQVLHNTFHLEDASLGDARFVVDAESAETLARVSEMLEDIYQEELVRGLASVTGQTGEFGFFPASAESILRRYDAVVELMERATQTARDMGVYDRASGGAAPRARRPGLLVASAALGLASVAGAMLHPGK